MKDKILSIISFITIFIPATILFVWNPAAPNATAIVIGYSVFVLASFIYAVFLFFKKHLRNIYINLGLVVNMLYIVGILGLVVIPRFL